MTARDEAIDATADVWDGYDMGAALDAIPPVVLARYAIERGGLEDDGTWVDPEDLSVHYEDEHRPDGALTLYRFPIQERVS